MGENQWIYLGALLFLILFLILVGVIVSKKVKTGEDFLMGGRGLPLFLLVGTTTATYIGTGSTMGAVQFSYENGWSGMLYGIGSCAGMIVLFFLFASVRKYNFMTFSEELSFYFGANKFIKGLTSILLYVASIGWLGAHILGGSLYLSWITGVDPTIAKVITALGFAILTFIGGYLAVVYTDLIQAIILFFGFILLTILSLVKLGGYKHLANEMPSDLVSFLGIEHFGIIPAISLIAVTAIDVLSSPTYRHRLYSGKNTSTVKKGFLISGILCGIFSLFPSIIGMSAKVMNPNLEAGYAFPYVATEVFPLLIGAIVLVSGLSATISSGSSDFITAVTISLRDVYQVITGKVPKKKNIIAYSRISMFITLFVAFTFTLFTNSIVDYISTFVSTVLVGLFIASILGKFWSRATWQGGFASLVGGSLTSFIVLLNAPLKSFFWSPILPALAGALLFGIVVSLMTPKKDITREEALKILAQERAIADEGTKTDTTLN